MINLSPATRIFVALAPVDMRQGFNGLSIRVQAVLAQDPLQGHLYVFSNRRHNRLKILYFDGSGLWICAKRLERGVFSWPQGEGSAVSFGSAELAALLSGLEIQAKAGWYRR